MHKSVIDGNEGQWLEVKFNYNVNVNMIFYKNKKGFGISTIKSGRWVKYQFEILMDLNLRFPH